MSGKAKHRTTPNVKAACEECRTKKTKCDGGRPACSRCIKKDKHCTYDAEPDEHRSATLRRKCKAFERQALAGERLLSAMRDLPEGEAVSLLQRLRAHEGIEAVAASLAERGPHEPNDRETSPSVAGSHSSAGSAVPPFSAAEESSRSRDLGRQQSEVHPYDAAADISEDGPSSDQRLAISFLVDDAAVSHSDASQQAPLRPSVPSVLRMASYAPVTAAAMEAHGRASAPVPFVVTGAQAIEPVAEGDRAGPAPDLGSTQNVGQAPDPGADWDQYFTNVSSLLRRIGESSHGASQ